MSRTRRAVAGAAVIAGAILVAAGVPPVIRIPVGLGLLFAPGLAWARLVVPPEVARWERAAGVVVLALVSTILVALVLDPVTALSRALVAAGAAVVTLAGLAIRPPHDHRGVTRAELVVRWGRRPQRRTLVPVALALVLVAAALVVTAISAGSDGHAGALVPVPAPAVGPVIGR